MNIEELYKDKLKNSEVAPPDAVWQQLSSQLEGGVLQSSVSEAARRSSTSMAQGATAMATSKVVAVVAAAIVAAVVATVAVIGWNNDNPAAADTVVVAHHDEDDTTAATANIESVMQPDVAIAATATASAAEVLQAVEPASIVSDVVADNTVVDEAVYMADNTATSVSADSRVAETEATVADVPVFENPKQEQEPIPEVLQQLRMEEDKTFGEIFEQVQKIEQENVDSLAKYLQEMFTAELSIPRIITPNHDNINDCWVIIGLENYNNVHVAVFSVSGKIIFESKNYDNTWCPTNLPDGSYFYNVVIRDKNYQKTGVLQIKSR